MKTAIATVLTLLSLTPAGSVLRNARPAPRAARGPPLPPLTQPASQQVTKQVRAVFPQPVRSRPSRTFQRKQR